MARIDVSQPTILRAILTALRSGLALNDRTCFLTFDPLAPPEIPKGGNFFVTVGPGESRFEIEEQNPHQTIEFWTITVTIYNRIQVDSAGHAEQALVEATRGLYAIRRKLLKCMVGRDLEVPAGSAEPSSNTFLRQLLYVQRSSRPQHDPEKMTAWLSVDLGVDFDIDLLS